MTTSQRDAGRLFARRMSRLTVLYAEHSGPDESKLPANVRTFLAHLVGLMWATYDAAVETMTFGDERENDQAARIRGRLFQLGRGLHQHEIDWARSVAEVAGDFDQVLDTVIDGDLKILQAARHAV